MENSDYYYRKYKKYKMLYKKEGGTAAAVAAWGRRTRGRMLGIGTIAVTMEIADGMVEIIKQQNIIKDDEAGDIPLKNRTNSIIEYSQKVKNAVGGATEHLDGPRETRKYDEKIIPWLNEAIEYLEKEIKLRLIKTFKYAEKKELEGKQFLQQATRTGDAASIDQAKSYMLTYKSIIDAAKKSYNILNKKIIPAIKKLKIHIKENENKTP